MGCDVNRVAIININININRLASMKAGFAEMAESSPKGKTPNICYFVVKPNIAAI